MKRLILWSVLIGTLLASMVLVYASPFTRCVKNYGGTAFQDGLATTAADFNCDIDGLTSAVNNISSAQITNATIADLDIASTGITTRSKLPVAVAYEDEINTFTKQNVLSLGIILTSQPFYYAATWNDGAVVFDVFQANITDTASSSISKLFNGKVGGSSKFSVDKSGNILSAATVTALTGTSHTASTACLTGYTRVGEWCMDTDGTLAIIRNVTTSDGAYVNLDTLTASNARIALIRSFVELTASDGAGDVIRACITPGDSAATTCTEDEATVTTKSNTGGEDTIDKSENMVRATGANGVVRVRCTQTGAAPGGFVCRWYLAGYMD